MPQTSRTNGVHLKLAITAEPRPDHADNIGHWLRIPKADRKAIFTAASAANNADEFPEQLL